MKKITLLLFAITLYAFSGMAQTYFEDFNAGMPSDMTLIDNDSLTPYYTNWVVGTPWISYERAGTDSLAMSTSYYSPSGQSDDWMITPSIAIATGDFLVWEAMAWDATYSDGYDVKLSTTSGTDMSTFTTTLLSVAAEQTVWTGHSIDLSTYDGQTVYIAFINNSSDMFILSIDNIAVMSTQFDVAPTAVIVPVKIGLNLAPFDVMGSVVNKGLTTITDYKLNYSVNGSATVSTVITPTAGFGTYGADDFAASWTPTAVGNYTIKVWVTDLNGTNVNPSATDTLSAQCEIVAQSVQRLPLYETFTSSTCGPCVAGNTNMDALFAANPNQWVCVKYQMSWPGSGDPYYTAEGGDRRTFYGVNSVPRQEIDGGYDGNSSAVTQGMFTSAYNTISMLDISAALNIYGMQTSLTVDMNPSDDISGNLKLFVAIAEGKTTGNVGSNGETEFHWVMKKMMPDANGTTLANFTNGTAVSKSLAYTFNGSYRLPADATNPIDNATEHSVEEFSDLIAVVWVQDVTTKEVLQSAFSSVTAGMSDAERANLITAVYPNPAQDQVNINLNMEQSENVEVSIFNTVGQVVLSENHGSMNGVNTLNIKLDNLSTGIYFVKIVVGDKVYTKPLQITK
ncbi:MAG: choice-of-anchor J domain-containing protein [Bacteroidales bacterium]|nr:choice-of-anchor J domain-containing protein [Bacteroidales bacterium]